MIEDFKPFHIRMIEQELLRRKLENPRYSLRAFARYLGIGSSSLSRIIKNSQEISPSSTRTIIKKLKFSEEDSILFLASIAEDKRRKSFNDLSDISADSLLSNSPGPIFVLNRKKQFLYVNEEAAKLYLQTPKELIGKTFPDVGASRFESESMSSLIDQTFEKVQESRQEDRITHNGISRWYERILIPIMGKDQNVQAVSCHLRDITDRKEKEFAINFLARSGKILSSSFDYKETLSNIIELIISELSDGCFIHIKNLSDKVELFDVSHKDEIKCKVLKSIFKEYPYDPDYRNFYHGVMKSGKPQFNPVVDEALLKKVGRNENHLSDLKKLDVGSYICVPLNTFEKTIGSATLIRSSGREPFTEFDLKLMQELSLRAAWAIDCTMRLMPK